MAGRARIDVHLFHGGAGMNHVAAGTRDRRVFVCWMDVFSHGFLSSFKSSAKQYTRAERNASRI
jgi:hypothetical protein